MSFPITDDSNTAAAKPKSKSLPLAILLNIIFPGAGMGYLGYAEIGWRFFRYSAFYYLSSPIWATIVYVFLLLLLARLLPVQLLSNVGIELYIGTAFGIVWLIWWVWTGFYTRIWAQPDVLHIRSSIHGNVPAKLNFDITINDPVFVSLVGETLLFKQTTSPVPLHHAVNLSDLAEISLDSRLFRGPILSVSFWNVVEPLELTIRQRDNDKISYLLGNIGKKLDATASAVPLTHSMKSQMQLDIYKHTFDVDWQIPQQCAWCNSKAITTTNDFECVLENAVLNKTSFLGYLLGGLLYLVFPFGGLAVAMGSSKQTGKVLLKFTKIPACESHTLSDLPAPIAITRYEPKSYFRLRFVSPEFGAELVSKHSPLERGKKSHPTPLVAPADASIAPLPFTQVSQTDSSSHSQSSASPAADTPVAPLPSAQASQTDSSSHSQSSSRSTMEILGFVTAGIGGALSILTCICFLLGMMGSVAGILNKTSFSTVVEGLISNIFCCGFPSMLLLVGSLGLGYFTVRQRNKRQVMSQ